MFYDVSKAYDHLSFETIKRGMEILHLPPKTQNYIMEKTKVSKYRIKTRYGITEPIDVLRGCPQGCPLSPIIYIIAIDPLHKGLENNPLYGCKDGYVISNGETGEEAHLPSKGYANDTAVVATSVEGLHRLTHWVNEFCIINRISTNSEKTLLFGRNGEGAEIETSIHTVAQLTEDHASKDIEAISTDSAYHKLTEVKPTPSNSKEIKYLGIWMNMDLTWEEHIKKLRVMVYRTEHIVRANCLDTEQALYLMNISLKPKLEYRMRFANIPKAHSKIGTRYSGEPFPELCAMADA